MSPAQSELSTMVITSIKAHQCWLHWKVKSMEGETKPWTRKQERDVGSKFTVKHRLAVCFWGNHSSAGNATFLI